MLMTSQRAVARRFFTLLEMLIVMVIMLMLMGISVGTYRTITRGNQVNNSARELGSVLRLARQTAVSKRRYVACIFPGAEANNLADTYRFTSYRLAIVEKVSSDFNFISWLEDSTWHFTPKTVSIMEVDDDAGIYDQRFGSYEPIPYDDESTMVNDVDFSQALGGGGSVSNVRAIVFSPHGRLQGDSSFVTIGRGTYAAGAWQISPRDNLVTNRSTPDQITISIHRYTGRLAYLNVSEYPSP